MILWLDNKIFGNGWGLSTPYFDQVFRWLDGELYTFSHGFGAQLMSIQWTHPRAGERRTLGGYEFKVFASARRWGRVRCSWGVVDLPKDIDEANTMLRQMDRDLGSALGRTWHRAPALNAGTKGDRG